MLFNTLLKLQILRELYYIIAVHNIFTLYTITLLLAIAISHVHSCVVTPGMAMAYWHQRRVYYPLIRLWRRRTRSLKWEIVEYFCILMHWRFLPKNNWKRNTWYSIRCQSNGGSPAKGLKCCCQGTSLLYALSYVIWFVLQNQYIVLPVHCNHYFKGVSRDTVTHCTPCIAATRHPQKGMIVFATKFIPKGAIVARRKIQVFHHVIWPHYSYPKHLCASISTLKSLVILAVLLGFECVVPSEYMAISNVSQYQESRRCPISHFAYDSNGKWANNDSWWVALGQLFQSFWFPECDDGIGIVHQIEMEFGGTPWHSRRWWAVFELQ